ncbi:hypothetical protein VSDG_01238 [Cytospora chrysosperma]|uniref:SCP domain-containing protein n=1 Tax=Cytospora chrysosperma TaxID=252740 RepID=A0A423WK46_CYTCH|nr:hypothetical protein VSDG_01238 [Valsa sordida]
MSSLTGSQRGSLIYDFLDESGTKYPTSTSVFLPRKNTEACEDYAGVFLCHAKLYVLGDKYDIPPLRQLTLHRLHATLKEFTLYPSRMNDIATLAKYVFENTVPEDKIRDMITLYYACIVEDATKYDGLKSLIDEIPDFAFASPAAGPVQVQTVTITAAPSIPSTAPQFTDTAKFTSAILNSTNFYRSEHNATAVSWNHTLAKYASSYLSSMGSESPDSGSECDFAHSGGPYGENLALGCNEVTGCVELWGDEREEYDFNNPGFTEGGQSWAVYRRISTAK